MLGDIIGKNSGLFLDLAVYSIIAENNVGQYYPDYAYNHPLFTDRMKIYSDTKKSLEHEAVEAKIDRMAECLHKHEDTKYEIKSGGFARYFDMIYYNKEKKDEKFMYGG